MNHPPIDHASADPITLQQQLLGLLRQQASRHKQMMAMIRKAPPLTAGKAAPLTWAELRDTQVRLEQEINRIRRRLN